MKKINFIRLLVLMMVLITSINSVWAADCGFWGDGAASITFKVDGSTSKTPSDLNDKNVADYNIGTVTSSLTIETAWVKVWGWNKIGGISLFYRVKEADSESDGSYTPATLGWDNNFNTNDQFWDWGGTNSSPGTLATININLAPGDYEIEFYYQITSYSNGGTSNSSYLNNTNVGNYHANFTIPSKNLTVAGAANGNEVDGSVEGITKGTAYTITATPTAGYAFSSWSATSGSSSISIANTASATTTVTFNDYANDATVTANFVVESTHNVSVSYMCSSTSIKTGTTESNVGVTTKREITAPTIDHYQFVEWVLGDGVVLADGYDEDKVTIEFNSVDDQDDEDYTLTATYKRLTRFYFANTGNWSKVYAYMWNSNDGNSGNTDNSGWSSNEITSQTKRLCETDIYYFDYDASAHSGWDHIIFHDNGGTPNKTSDLTIADHEDDIYILSSTKWDNINLHTVSVVSEASHKGSVSGGGTASSYGCSATITATPEPGYRFNGWTVTSGTASIADASSTETTVTASTDATITANFTNDQFIYLKKDAISGSWGGDVYVYFYSKEYWDKDGKGTGSKNGDGMTVRGPFKMNKLNDKDQIYYYDYSGMANVGTYKTTQYVAFADHSMSEYGNFSACQAIYRGDFYPDANMFVVEDYKSYYNTKASAGQAVYYNGGYWMKFNDSDPGYVLKVYNLKTGGSLLYSSRFSGTAGGYTFTTTKRFTGADLYFELLGCDTLTKNGIGYSGTYYNNTGTMTSSNAPYGWTFYHNVGRCGLKASATGDYTFTLSCTDGHLSVKVDFPVAIGDMRVLYSGKVSTTGSAKAHPSRFIRLLGKPTIASDSTQTDTISFFIVNGSSPTIRYQRCDNFDGSGNPIWKDTIGSTYNISSFETGIYTFVITQTSYKGATANSTSCASKGLYSGDFYIRTDEAGGGWQGYAASPNSKMIQSDIALAHGGYDYYHCHWIKKSHNAQFTIASKYSECISDTLKDDAYTSGDGNLPDSASVRFMWNSSTNVIGRAYLSGSNDGEAEFLKIQSDPSKTDTDPEGDGVTLASLAGIIKSDGTRYTNNTATFSDLNNWVYQLDVKVKEGARIKLTSNYRYNSTDHIQYFKGLSWKEGDAGTAWDDNHTAPILGGSEKKYQSLRIVYDFKTNHLLSAWLADGDPITGNAPVAINTDVIILREGQDDARQITFSGTGSLTEVDMVYGVISFNKWTLNNKNTTEPHAALDPAKSVYERDLYWISFPFDVKLNDVFGFGTYGTHWIVEYYDGKGRAKNGFWADSPSNWKFLPRDTILHANEGYILALDLDMLGESSKVWENSVEDVYLYFPSKESVGNIQATSVEVTFANQNAYKCTINRGTAQGDRRIKDSYWHCIGVPSYANATNSISESATPTPIPGTSAQDSWTASIPFLYVWDASENTLSVSESSDVGTFKAMNSYLVQFSGETLAWENVTNTASSVAARLTETPDREFKLALIREDEEQDHTYVRLTDDANVSNRFEFNYDLSKEYNAGRGNIWTVTADTVEVAGNCMPKPVQTTVVPVGVKVVANGEYTLAMPEGTNGENVVLIDNAYGTRTNLGLMPYTVTLTAGTYDSRFALEFAPIQETPTNIEQMSTVNYQMSTEEVRKVFVGGRLYIIRDGKVYDAAGQRVE